MIEEERREEGREAGRQGERRREGGSRKEGCLLLVGSPAPSPAKEVGERSLEGKGE